MALSQLKNGVRVKLLNSQSAYSGVSIMEKFVICSFVVLIRNMALNCVGKAIDRHG